MHKNNFFKKTHNKKEISSIGFGMYKGEESSLGDKLWFDSLLYGFRNKINVIDTAQKYRNGRSEKILGKALKYFLNKNKLKKREDFIIISKTGLLPDYFFKKKIFNKIQLKKNNCLFNMNFCIDPNYIKWSVDNSLKNIKTNYIDFYLLHNPENAFFLPGGFNKIIKALETLEKIKKTGKIKFYGIASWNGFRRNSKAKLYLDLEKIIVALKNKIGVNNGFKFIEAPISVGMPRILSYQSKGKKLDTIIKKNNMNLFSSASMYEGKLEQLINLNKIFCKKVNEDFSDDQEKANVSIPESENSILQLFQLLLKFKKKNINLNKLLFNFSNRCRNLYHGNLNLLLSLSFINCCLIGMEKKEYVRKNIKVLMSKKVSTKSSKYFWKST